METYGDLEQTAAQSRCEFDSIIFQIQEMETQVLKMQMQIIKLKTYICGSLSYEQFRETR